MRFVLPHASGDGMWEDESCTVQAQTSQSEGLGN
jgi:hypothetical protein